MNWATHSEVAKQAGEKMVMVVVGCVCSSPAQGKETGELDGTLVLDSGEAVVFSLNPHCWCIVSKADG